MDLIQLRTVCHALGTTLSEFVNTLEARLQQSQAQEHGPVSGG